MKVNNQIKRERRHKRKKDIKVYNPKRPIPSILLNKTQQKPLTVKNGVVRKIFVAGQPIKIMTNYTQV